MRHFLSMTMTVTVDENGKVELFSSASELAEEVVFAPVAGSKAEALLRDAVLSASWSKARTYAVTGLRLEEIASPIRPHVFLFGDPDGVDAAVSGFEDSLTESGVQVVHAESPASLVAAIRKLRAANREIGLVKNSPAMTERGVVIVDVAEILRRAQVSRVEKMVAELLDKAWEKSAPWSVVLCMAGPVPAGTGEGTGRGSWVFPDVRPVVALGPSVVWAEVEPLLRLTETDFAELSAPADRWVYRTDEGSAVFVD